jgi:hypothetical protein
MKTHIKRFYKTGEKNTQRGSPRYVLIEVLEGKRPLRLPSPQEMDNQRRQIERFR